MKPPRPFLPKLEDARFKPVASAVWRAWDSARIFLSKPFDSFLQKPSVTYNAALLGRPCRQLTVAGATTEVNVRFFGRDLGDSSFDSNLSARPRPVED